MIDFVSSGAIVDKDFISSFSLRVGIPLLLSVFLLGMLSCGKTESTFREYTETTSRGKFGAGGVGASGPVSSREVDLFNRITSSQSLSAGIIWQTPAEWKEVKESGVRLVSFRTRNNLEVTLVAFPGNVGGVRANLSRWLGQIDVNLSDTEMEGLIDNLEIDKTTTGGKELSYILVDFDNYPPIVEQNPPDTTLAAIFGFSDQMLFVKLSGIKDSVRADKDDFLRFIKTIRIKSV